MIFFRTGLIVMTFSPPRLGPPGPRLLPYKSDHGGVETVSPYDELRKIASSIDMKMAVVDVLPGESNIEAWQRHLHDYPNDANAMIKIFNQPRRESQQQYA